MQPHYIKVTYEDRFTHPGYCFDHESGCKTSSLAQEELSKIRENNHDNVFGVVLSKDYDSKCPTEHEDPTKKTHLVAMNVTSNEFFSDTRTIYRL